MFHTQICKYFVPLTCKACSSFSGRSNSTSFYTFLQALVIPYQYLPQDSGARNHIDKHETETELQNEVVAEPEQFVSNLFYITRVADPDPVGSGIIILDPDPELSFWIRIRPWRRRFNIFPLKEGGGTYR